ncbi:LysR family transcriptional regulator [Paenibacillus sp. FSL H7-0326]|uniref:LysR family transcriptional regulator n=1 Tax=Paenibacillus sp. FSL H7-0326 TaxID=1921144 RepID=UPI000970171C|nr:LysR family transcriptional regulator [Paenibacillus sp. FSL H7-0326]OMC70703.1 LysR family transcriptional regulator [Paenibacillus sp. FSL H7-0326]
MDISQIEALLAVCKIRNFTKAAEFLHISQSAVTARIKALEATLGKTLLDRDKRNVRLTQAGIAFLPYAERMLRIYEESKVTLQEEVDHHLIVSGPGSVWHYTYLQNMLDFREKHPSIAVKFLSYIDSSYMIRDLLLDGIVQLALRYDPPEHPKFTKKFLFEEEIILVSSKPRENFITRTDFYDQNYYHIEWGHPFPEWFRGIVGDAYIPPLQTDHSAIMLTMLLQGGGFGYLPRAIADPYIQTGQLYELPTEFTVPPSKVYAVYLTDNQDDPRIELGLEMLGIE